MPGSGVGRLIASEISNDSKGEAYLKEVGEAFSPKGFDEENSENAQERDFNEK